MKDTLLKLVTQIVEHPDDVVINETQEETRIILTIHVHPEDMGRIIGKNGRIIRAIRDIVKIIAAKNQTYVDIVLA